MLLPSPVSPTAHSWWVFLWLLGRMSTDIWSTPLPIAASTHLPVRSLFLLLLPGLGFWLAEVVVVLTSLSTRLDPLPQAATPAHHLHSLLLCLELGRLLIAGLLCHPLLGAPAALQTLPPQALPGLHGPPLLFFLFLLFMVLLVEQAVELLTDGLFPHLGLVGPFRRLLLFLIPHLLAGPRLPSLWLFKIPNQ